MIKNIITKLFFWYGKRNVIVVALITITLGIVGVYMKFGTSTVTIDTALQSQKTVTLIRVGDMKQGVTALSILGTVESTREARLQTEAGGRVTAVNAKLGDIVRAGVILATIENSRERAVVLQAQGAYEGALAGGHLGVVSIDTATRSLEEANIGARNTYRSSFTTVDTIVRGTLDQLFSKPDSLYPGVVIDSKGQATTLNAERVALGKMLTEWKTSLDTTAKTNNPTELLTLADTNVRRVAAFATVLSNLFADGSNNPGAIPPNLTTFGPALTAARSQLDGALAGLSANRSALTNAGAGLSQAKISGTSGTASVTDAQIKQALGSLRLAQSSLEKTIIRTPISGTVQSLTLKAGSTVGQGQPAAVVSSEGAFEVIAYVTDEDVRTLEVGDTVSIEGGVAGVVTAIASAIDPVTKKIELRIGISDSKGTLTNGQAVTVSVASNTSGVKTNTVVRLPIVALKMTPEGAVVFTVDTNKKLVSHTVVLGAISGDTVIIANGVTSDMVIVSDARGLRAEEVVTTN